jgi:solute carrier family 8 (sodium/calcium exchanger)
MALGSSAPEILLSIIETLQYINETPGDLGPSTIVGSAAFNFLIITGACIVAVDGGVKPINDLGVFTITSISSIFAYLWLMYTLSINTPNLVTTGEAWLTFAFFWILIIISYGADRYNKSKK